MIRCRSRRCVGVGMCSSASWFKIKGSLCQLKDGFKMPEIWILILTHSFIHSFSSLWVDSSAEIFSILSKSPSYCNISGHFPASSSCQKLGELQNHCQGHFNCFTGTHNHNTAQATFNCLLLVECII